MEWITQDMADTFNDFVSRLGSSYRIIKSGGNDYSWEITIIPDVFEKHRPVIYPNKEYFMLLENFFTDRGIEITYNNTRSTFWTNQR